MITLLEDLRPIRAIWFVENDTGYKVGVTCDEIRVYAEMTAIGASPWFAVKKGGQIITRVNASKVAVVAYE